MSFKATFFNDRVLCVYALQGIAPGSSWLGGVSLKDYMENKNKGNENKVILGDFDCTMDKMERDAGNKTQSL